MGFSQDNKIDNFIIKKELKNRITRSFKQQKVQANQMTKSMTVQISFIDSIKKCGFELDSVATLKLFTLFIVVQSS